MALNRTQSPEDDQRVDRSDTAARILDVAERLVQLQDSTGSATPTLRPSYISQRPACITTTRERRSSAVL